jgi:hypothetical protein
MMYIVYNVPTILNFQYLKNVYNNTMLRPHEVKFLEANNKYI